MKYSETETQISSTLKRNLCIILKNTLTVLLNHKLCAAGVAFLSLARGAFFNFIRTPRKFFRCFGYLSYHYKLSRYIAHRKIVLFHTPIFVPAILYNQ